MPLASAGMVTVPPVTPTPGSLCKANPLGRAGPEREEASLSSAGASLPEGGGPDLAWGHQRPPGPPQLPLLLSLHPVRGEGQLLRHRTWARHRSMAAPVPRETDEAQRGLVTPTGSTAVCREGQRDNALTATESWDHLLRPTPHAHTHLYTHTQTPLHTHTQTHTPVGAQRCHTSFGKIKKTESKKHCWKPWSAQPPRPRRPRQHLRLLQPGSPRAPPKCRGSDGCGGRVMEQ